MRQNLRPGGAPYAARVADGRRFWYYHCHLLTTARLRALCATLADESLDVPDRTARLRCTRRVLARREVRMARA